MLDSEKGASDVTTQTTTVCGWSKISTLFEALTAPVDPRLRIYAYFFNLGSGYPKGMGL